MLAFVAPRCAVAAPRMPLVRAASTKAGGKPAAASAAAAAAAAPSADAKEFQFIRPFKLHKLDGAPTSAFTTKDELLDMYKQMQRMRRVEIAADQLYKSKDIRGFCHLYLGQEAIAEGLERAITHEDHLITAYRDHAMMLGRGASMESVLAELLGRSTGCARGKGGSMHMYVKDTNFYGGNGIVGAQCPMGAGIAFAQKYFNTGKVCMAFYGDGAANQGQLYEAFNMASLWKLPVLFCCENNQYAMGTSIERGAALPEFYTKGQYVPGIWIDGMDVLAVKEGTKFAADYARTNGPVVIEYMTYRYSGHSMSDPGTTYRTRDEVAKVREGRDCLALTKKRLLDSNWATEDDLKAIDAAVKEETDAAVAAAKGAPYPPVHETFTHVYKEHVPIRTTEFINTYVPPPVTAAQQH